MSATPLRGFAGLIAGARTSRRWTGPHTGALIVVVTVGLVSSAGVLAQPLIAERVLTRLDRGDSIAGPICLLVVLLVASAAIDWIHVWLAQRLAERVTIDVRRAMSERFMAAEVGALDCWPRGELSYRLTTDSAMVGQFTTQGIVQVARGLVTLAAAVVLMTVVDAELLLLCVIVVGLGASAIVWGAPRVRQAMESQQQAAGRLADLANTSMGNIRMLRASGADQQTLDGIDAQSALAFSAGMRSAVARATIWVANASAVQIAFVVVLSVGGLRIADGDLTVAQLIAFLLYLTYLNAPIIEIATGVTSNQSGRAATERIELVLELPQEHDRQALSQPASATTLLEDSAPKSRAKASLSLRDVVFGYDTTRPPVLSHVTFDAPATGLVAIVGRSGAGKSTILQLVEGFYLPWSGTVEMAGQSSAESDLRDWRARLAYVDQDSTSVEGSLRDNVALGAPQLPDESVRDALIAAGLGPFVNEHGIDAPVGQDGIGLSGGERQRLAIARAIARRPDLLLMDEPTAHLDGRSREVLVSTLDSLREKCCVIVVTHRMDLAAVADLVVWLRDDASVVAGLHDNLLGSTDYRQLVRSGTLVDVIPET